MRPNLLPPALLLLVALTPVVHAQSTQEILRQRLPDGSVVFTDRPQSGGRTEKRWTFDSEDPVAAAARRAEVQSEASTVSERIARYQADQRAFELQAELARSRAAQAAAEREAERARAEAAEAPRYIVWPAWRVHPLGPPGMGERPHPPTAKGGVAPGVPRPGLHEKPTPPRRGALDSRSGI